MRLGGLLLFSALFATSALADAPPRDAKSWAALIDEAKKHGGTQTRLDKSSSYVFQQQDGNFLTLTEWRSPPKRFVCVIARDQQATVCVSWETGRTTYGERADDASPWKAHTATPLEDTKEITEIDRFFAGIGDFVGQALGCSVGFVGSGRLRGGAGMSGVGSRQMVLHPGGMRRP